MATYQNPAIGKNLIDPCAAGELRIRETKFDFAAAYRPATNASGDLFEIFVVPAGCKLVPNLTVINVPAIDTHGTPTGDYEIGTAADPNALTLAAAAETAVVLSGEDFVFATASVGSKTADTPVYVKLTNNVATLSAAGVITSRYVVRPWDDAVDA